MIVIAVLLFVFAVWCGSLCGDIKRQENTGEDRCITMPLAI